MLHSDYYWPNMQHDLFEAYIPVCVECQWNKSLMMKPTGPLHPLPILDQWGNSITIDFIGPCPHNNNFDCIVTITDHLGSDIHVAPMHMDILAEHFSVEFFDLWCCENGLPLNIVSNQDKLFVSKFWKVLVKLTGMKLKMSSAYHLEMDGSSERSNMSIMQCLQYHVEHNQTSWVRALPLVCFNIMNTVNSSMGFSPLQLHMCWSPHLMPPLASIAVIDPSDVDKDYTTACNLIEHINTNISEVQDNLLVTKITQCEFANHHHANEDVSSTGNRVLLSTKHCWREYVQAMSDCVAKFML